MADQFTEEQFSLLKDAFLLFATDHKEVKDIFTDTKENRKKLTISAKGLGCVLKLVGKKLTSAELVENIGAAGNGKIDFDQFLHLMAHKMETPENEDEIQEAFDACDKYGTGFISVADLRDVMANLGEELTMEEVQEVIRAANVDAMEMVSFEEFKAIRRLVSLN